MQNISPIKQRILQFVDSLGISKRDFYSKTGISRGTLESNTGITEDTLAKLFTTYTDLNPNWVFTGSGSIKKNDNIAHDTDPPPYTKECPACKEKERLINALSESLKTKDITIKSLTEQIELLKGKCEAHEPGGQKRKAVS